MSEQTKAKKSRVKYPESLLVRMTKAQKKKLKKNAKRGAMGEGELLRNRIDTLPE